MKLIIYEGAVHPPFQFDSEIFMSNIFSLYINNLPEPVHENIYKYNSFEEWIIYVGVVTILIALALCKHESISTILRSQIPWLIRWGRAFLSRGQEEIPSNEETN